ncbi:GDP-mannose 4,6-dehydratase [Dactylosporangium sp. NPDC050588]|uniref:GDP-mannose 4,6-dehydratase n=1 Tax=Dactylosporangium aurantiacum subsp. hamdenensis TaxID=703577 RepID=E9LIM5_9ACTN|nr:GDP-mannose 4,6-dehydratase [Dactylosporangium aurantiacum subsp. hamdenensis]
MTRRALITGIRGQDGSYLAEHLLAEGYDVWGLVRGEEAAPRIPVAPHLEGAVRLISGDLLDQRSLIAAIEQCEPDEVYNLAAISYVPQSWRQPEATAEVTGVGVVRILEAIRTVSGVRESQPGRGGQIRFYQASSSAMYGNARETPQNELTPLHPHSPYGVAKAYGHYMTKSYRESYGMHAMSGIMFNHESPRRGRQFVTRKVSVGVARIKLGQATELRIGNLDAQVDWGFAGDFARAMHLMVSQHTADDYVIGTGRLNSVRQLVELAFSYVGLQWRRHVRVDPQLVRPADVVVLRADYGKAAMRLGWHPSTPFEDVVAQMLESDMRLLSIA